MSENSEISFFCLERGEDGNEVEDENVVDLKYGKKKCLLSGLEINIIYNIA